MVGRPVESNGMGSVDPADPVAKPSISAVIRVNPKAIVWFQVA